MPSKTKKQTPKDTVVTVVWRHASIRMCGKRHGELVELPRGAAEAYIAKRWAAWPPTTQEAPDVSGDAQE